MSSNTDYYHLFMYQNFGFTKNCSKKPQYQYYQSQQYNRWPTAAAQGRSFNPYSNNYNNYFPQNYSQNHPQNYPQSYANFHQNRPEVYNGKQFYSNEQDSWGYNDLNNQSSIFSKKEYKYEPNVYHPQKSINTSNKKKNKEQLYNQSYFQTATETITPAICPFNPQHVTTKQKILTHINRCIKSFPDLHLFSLCPYDPTHYYHINAIDNHIKTCPKRSQLIVVDQKEIEQEAQRKASVWQINYENIQVNSHDSSSTTALSGKSISGDSVQKINFQNFILEDI